MIGSKRASKAISDKTADLLKRMGRITAGGAPEKVESQKKAGKLLARQRLEMLLDEDSFQELDMLRESRCRDFGLDEKHLPADGVVTGTGRIHGRSVCVFSQDFTVLGGTIGQAHAEKICKVLDLAISSGVPVIGLFDSGGARIQEGVDALGGYADIFNRNVKASGRVPQIAAILGPCAGGAAFSPALADFVFMVKGMGKLFITGPGIIREATGEDTDLEALGGAEAHSARSGVCHFTANSEQDCFRQIHDLLEYLPQNWRELPREKRTEDDPKRESAVLDRIAHLDTHQPYDIHEVIWEIADDRNFLEVHKAFARNLVCGFVHLGGQVAGVVANNPKVRSGSLDGDASEKGARFVRFCDAYGIPVVTLVDVPGYWPGVEQEHGGLLRRGAKLLYAYCQATVPKVTVVLKKAYGGAYDVMGSKHVGGDCNLAWPCAEISVMSAHGAVDILYSGELKKAADPGARREELSDEFMLHFSSPFLAAQRGYVDEVMEAKLTRPKIIRALQFLRHKKVESVAKKHGNIPL